MTTQNETVIEVQDLRRKFRRALALDGLSLEVPKGGVFGLVGENGAGKTTLIRHILGLFRAQFGTGAGLWSRSGRSSGGSPRAYRLSLGRSRFAGLDEHRRPHAVYALLLSQLGRRLCRAVARGLRVGSESQDPHPLPGAIGESRAFGRACAQARFAPLGRAVFRARCDWSAATYWRRLFARWPMRDARCSSLRTFSTKSSAWPTGWPWCSNGKVVLDTTMEEVREMHHRVVLRGHGGEEAAPEVPGVLSSTYRNGEWTLVCNAPLDAVRSAATANGWELLELSSPSLEEIFVVRPGKENPSGRPHHE